MTRLGSPTCSHTPTRAVRLHFDDMMSVLFSFRRHYFSPHLNQQSQFPVWLSQWINPLLLSHRKAGYRYSRCCVRAPVCMQLEKCWQAGSQTARGCFTESCEICLLYGTVQWLCMLRSPGIHSTPPCLCRAQPHPGWPAREQKTFPTTCYSHTLARVRACTHTNPSPLLLHL